MKLGAIEAGGTKFVVCIGNEKGEVLERESFPTEAPEKTMENVFKFFDGKEIEALGVGSFGPIDPDLTVQLMVILQQHLNQDGIIITLWVL